MKSINKCIFTKEIYDLVLTFEYGSILIDGWLNDKAYRSKFYHININDDHFIIFNIPVEEAYDEKEQHIIVKSNELLPLTHLGDI